MKKHLYYLLFLLLMMAADLPAQNITGRWEGIMYDQFLQVNVIQQGNELCGYTYDYVLGDRGSHCRAKFSGYYDPKKKEWVLQGSDMIENSGGHVLMKLFFSMDGAKDNLTGKLARGGLLGKLITKMSDGFLLTKTSEHYTPLGIQMLPCFPPVTVFPDRKQKKGYTTVIINDTLPGINNAAPVVFEKQNNDIAALADKRQQKEQSHLFIDTNTLNLKLYDNGVVDNDTISVIYNGKLLISHQRLSEKPVELNIDIDTTQLLHTITLYAENLGTIPPNTALVIVTAGSRRYELYAKADLKENAVLVFEYKKE